MGRMHDLKTLLRKFQPVRHVSLGSSFPLAMPSARELHMMGRLRKGEVAISRFRKRLHLTYGTRDLVQAHGIVMHNHPEYPIWPSGRDAKSSLWTGDNVEYICNHGHITQVRYSFWKSRSRIHLSRGHHSGTTRKSRHSFKVKKEKFHEPTTITDLPTESCKGTYDITILPWDVFKDNYENLGFWYMFDRRRSWENLF